MLRRGSCHRVLRCVLPFAGTLLLHLGMDPPCSLARLQGDGAWPGSWDASPGFQLLSWGSGSASGLGKRNTGICCGLW